MFKIIREVGFNEFDAFKALHKKTEDIRVFLPRQFNDPLYFGLKIHGIDQDKRKGDQGDQEKLIIQPNEGDRNPDDRQNTIDKPQDAYFYYSLDRIDIVVDTVQDVSRLVFVKKTHWEPDQVTEQIHPHIAYDVVAHQFIEVVRDERDRNAGDINSKQHQKDIHEIIKIPGRQRVVQDQLQDIR